MNLIGTELRKVGCNRCGNFLATQGINLQAQVIGIRIRRKLLKR